MTAREVHVYFTPPDRLSALLTAAPALWGIEVYAVWLNDGTAELGAYCTGCSGDLGSPGPGPVTVDLSDLLRMAVEHRRDDPTGCRRPADSAVRP